MATKGLGLWLGLGSAKVEELLTANTNYKEQYKKLTSVKPQIKNGITNT
jgi:hypothetical protein